MAKLGKNYIASLDIGTSKVACFIAEIDHEGQLQILGIGNQLAQGIKSGAVIDIKLAENCIRSAVASAEQMAGVNIDRVIINISGNQQISHYAKVEMPINGQEISSRDIVNLLEQACMQYQDDNTEVIHCIALEYNIDGTGGIADPVGMVGKVLSCQVHIISAPSTNLYNIANCLAKCHLDIEDYICSAYASAYACTNDNEKELGCIAIDIGSSNTSIAAFKSGNITYTESIPLGGNHITNDLALGLNINTENAERLKTLHGSVITSASDQQEIVEIAQETEGGEVETIHIEKASIIDIVKPRVEEIIEIAQKNLSKAGHYSCYNNIILTGGTSHIIGIKDLANNILKKPTRLGHPKYIPGIAESTKGLSFAASIGILLFTQAKRQKIGYNEVGGGLSKYFTKIFRWLSDNF